MSSQPLEWNTMLYLPLTELRAIAIKSPEVSEIISSPEFWKQRLLIDFPNYELSPLEPNNWQQLYQIAHSLLSGKNKARDIIVPKEVSRSFGYPDSAFAHPDERTEELGIQIDDQGEHWPPNSELMNWLLSQGLKKGDFVTFEAGSGYRNDARWYYIGDNTLRIDHNPDDYGTCPKELQVLTGPEWRPVDYWVRDGESMNGHNWIVRFDAKPYWDEIQNNLEFIKQGEDYKVYKTWFLFPMGLKINIYGINYELAFFDDLNDAINTGVFMGLNEDIDIPDLDSRTTLYV